MFVQVIRGRVADAESLRRQFDRWEQELRQGADGFVGTTGGISPTGEFISVVRFADEASARKNSSRPEQGAWWAETEKCFEGPVTFSESTEVDTFLRGGSDSAGFVQVMIGRCSEPARLRELEKALEQGIAEGRPDLIGASRVWHEGGRFTEVAYFTSEAAAREGEARAVPEEVGPAMAEWERIMGDLEYLDLPDPWLRS